MILEWAVIRGNYSQITGNDISNMLQRAAQRNEALTYPNNIWGYGMVNVNNLFDSLSLNFTLHKRPGV
jgi:anti-sigma regulatory factor (Ser/Thr protein kinase)